MYTRQILQGFIDYLDEEGRSPEANAVRELFLSVGDTQLFMAGQVADILEKNGFSELSDELGEKWMHFYDPAV